MSEFLKPESLDAIMSELTTNRLVGLIRDKARKGNHYMRWIESGNTIDFAQNFRFIHLVTLKDYELTVMTSHERHESDWEDEPCALSLWLNDGENDEEWYWFLQDTDDGSYYSEEPLTEHLGQELIAMLEDANLLDNLRPENIYGPDGGHQGYFRQLNPE